MPELNPMTFDLAAVLAGQDYPTDTVTVYFNSALGYAIDKVREGRDLAVGLGKTKEAKELDQELEGLIKSVKGSEYTVHLTGIPQHVRKSVLAKAQAAFPDKKNAFGIAEDNFEQDQEYTKLLWLAMITKIVDPSGATSPIDEAAIDNLIKFAPARDQKSINAGINKLSEGSDAGFEFAVQELDFLSTPSATDAPEA